MHHLENLTSAGSPLAILNLASVRYVHIPYSFCGFEMANQVPCHTVMQLFALTYKMNTLLVYDVCAG